MDLSKIKYPPVPDPTKTSYLTYAPSSTRRFSTSDKLTRSRSAVTRRRNDCRSYYINYYKNKQEAHIERMCCLIFKSDGALWDLMPEESFAVTPIDGYPVIMYQSMYNIPVEIKPQNMPIKISWTQMSLMTPKARKKFQYERYIWIPVKALVDSHKNGNV